MKNLVVTLSALILATFAHTTALAVTTSQCPHRILIDMKDLKVTRSLNDIQTKDLMGWASEPEKQLVQQALKNVYATRGIQRWWNIEKRENGRCVYSENKNYEKAELYTKEGRSVLLIQTALGPNGVMLRVYAQVMGVTPAGIQFSRTSSPGLALAIPRTPYDHYSAGGPLAFIGQVNSFSVIVR